jgi:hypothetical protein
MGQGQSEVALQLLRECAKTGENTSQLACLLAGDGGGRLKL